MTGKKLQPWLFSPESWKERVKRGQPTVPTKIELRFYEKYVRGTAKTDTKNAFVLGVTPELRDICLKHRFKTHSIDVSQDMIDVAETVIKHKNHPDDIVMKGDWFEMKFADGFFDIVLGDASFCNLATKAENRKLFAIVKKIIMPGGYLVIRNIFCPEIKPIPIKKLVSLYRQKKMHFCDFLMELRGATYLDRVYNKKTFQYDAKKNFDLIEKDIEKGLFSSKEAEGIMVFRNNIINTYYPVKEFIKLAEGFGFKLVERFQSPEYRYMKYLNMCVFQRK